MKNDSITSSRFDTTKDSKQAPNKVYKIKPPSFQFLFRKINLTCGQLYWRKNTESSIFLGQTNKPVTIHYKDSRNEERKNISALEWPLIPSFLVKFIEVLMTVLIGKTTNQVLIVFKTVKKAGSSQIYRRSIYHELLPQ